MSAAEANGEKIAFSDYRTGLVFHDFMATRGRLAILVMFISSFCAD